MLLSDFDYDLPEELIAQRPLKERDAARMLVVDRERRNFEDHAFRELPSYLKPGDCLVLNDSRVMPCRLIEGRIELLLIEPLTEDAREWRALAKPGRKLQSGARVTFGDSLVAEILETGSRGERIVRLEADGDIYAAVERLGHVPLPPYIRREDAASDRERYQTVFARERGSAAAPTAGLHFTPATLAACRESGAEIATLTLHVGLGTFQPIDREDFENHHLHAERYTIAAESWARIQAAERVIAVGTTAVRTVESAAETGRLSGATNLFIHPGCRFRRVNAMLTNFHLPKTSLLLLVCAFAGTGLTLAAYRHAVSERYRFFSYGDCMLVR